jgi:hypothetical protein
MRKPIIQCVDTCNSRFLYKYVHTGYVLDVSIPFCTDMTYTEFCNFLNGKYNMEEVTNFEETGTFQKSPKYFLAKC